MLISGIDVILPHNFDTMRYDRFADKHNGTKYTQLQTLLNDLGADSMESFIEQVIPDQIRLDRNLRIDDGMDEHSYLG